MLSPGDAIDRFEIVAVLGEGGMGTVYHARDLRLVRDVALKILRADDAAELDTGGAARIAREARAIAGLEHPNVVAFYDVGEIVLPGESAPTAYLAMELVDGKPLRAFIGDASVGVEQRIEWLRQIASALDAVHRIGLVHRDVKPENVMIRENGCAKVLDFGIARRTHRPVHGMATSAAQALSTLTSSGATAGTPRYMAPEQMLGETVDGRADQFAWGLVAYELLGGVPAWVDALDAVRLVAAILTRTPERLNEVALGLPIGVAAVVERALAKSPVARFTTMQDLLAKLDACPKPRGSRAQVAVEIADAPASDVPMARGVILHSIHEALRGGWGEEQLASVVAALPAEIARATFGPEYSPLTWYPVAYLEAWHEAIHAGPAAGDDRVYAECMDRALDVSLGRMRRAVMRLMNPVKLVQKSSDLWRSFHTHGVMTVEFGGGTSARATLTGHPFITTRIGRLTFASMVRYTLALSRAKHVRQEHEVDTQGRLVVSVAWGVPRDAG